MVVDVGPLAHVVARPVELRPRAAEHVGDLARDELLDVLVGPVVVGAVRERGVDAERPRPGPHEQVRAGLGGRVRARRVVRRLLGELVVAVEVEVAEDLVGGDVVQPRAVPADRLEDRVGADQVGLDERLGVVQRVVDVRLGREVHDGVALRDELVDQRAVADVAVHELDLVLDRLQALAVAGVGERVQHDHLVLGVVAHRVVDEVRADEPGGAGGEQLHASTSVAIRWAASPSCHDGRVGASGRVEPRTE